MYCVLNLQWKICFFYFCSTRWSHRGTNARIPTGNTAYETNRVSLEHIEFIGLLHYGKSHVPCSGVCKEWGFTPVPPGKERAGDMRWYLLIWSVSLRKPSYLLKRWKLSPSATNRHLPTMATFDHFSQGWRWPYSRTWKSLETRRNRTLCCHSTSQESNSDTLRIVFGVISCWLFIVEPR